MSHARTHAHTQQTHMEIKSKPKTPNSKLKGADLSYFKHNFLLFEIWGK